MGLGTSSLARSLRAGARLIVAPLVVGLCVLGGLSIMLFSSLPGASGEAQAVGRGVTDYRLEQTIVQGSVPAMVQEIGPERLGAKWTRLLVHWNALQPTDGPYSPTVNDANADGYANWYVAQLDGLVEQLHAVGVSVILTPTEVPKWASDSSLWGTLPGAGRGYKSFYAMNVRSAHVLSQFKALGRFLASRYDGEVRHFEVWNEPNLGLYLYPQNLRKTPLVGARTYLKMLRPYSQGVHAGADGALVIAGGTAPRGTGNHYSTAPQVFARYLKDHKAASLFNAYSHHPYTPGGTRQIAPSGKPNNPKRVVILSNLSQITKLFPSKPFYLTEYGYNTHHCKWFGVSVPQATQARYLRQAYSYVAGRYRQVKALLWYQVDDWAPHGYDGTGVYTGLRTDVGQRKLGWYAFAGHNKLTLVTAPGHARSGATFTLSGVLTYRAPDPPLGQRLTLQARKSSKHPWAKVVTALTRPDGSYSFSVKQIRTKIYRVVWDGVSESAARTVRTP